MASTERHVEVAAIVAAESYAAANGWPRDRKAAGLVLAGMAVMAQCPPRVRQAFVTMYGESFPDAIPTHQLWADFMVAAAEDGD